MEIFQIKSHQESWRKFEKLPGIKITQGSVLSKVNSPFPRQLRKITFQQTENKGQEIKNYIIGEKNRTDLRRRMRIYLHPS